ncbi:FadR family transcriptional regulator [Spongiibacter nanhainus]|uniref:FadR family transcriptional regulator n=1 Tax=Spongiibacter nanhainus TaxID=2794344 RepID=A0A7T4QZ54_9GAMM|nr:FCD domain-containing protein [Spongiibacter nanhainus]QQD17312.1 FadR family transcriptional regulator [Spongiibacter nanhainus]
MDRLVAKGPKLAHSLAKQITQDIVVGKLGADAFLGPERTLLDRYGVSRDTFREALRQLEWLGIVRAQRGAKGGLYVQSPSQASVVNLLRDYFDFSQANFDELLVVRSVLERELVRAAIESLTDRDVVRLRILQGQFEAGMSRDQFVVLLFSFYRHLMEIAGNKVITFCLMPLIFVTVDIANFGKLSDAQFASNSEVAWSKLKSVVDEVIAGNAFAADRPLQEFLDFTGQSVGTQIATLHSESTYPAWFDLSHSKMAEGLIYRIHRDIRSSGCCQGDRLGTEAELMERYQVSRSTFREACRVLEVVGLVQMQKGRDGGLKVAQPQPDNAIAAVVYYLNAIKVPYVSLTAVRNAIELTAIPLAASNVTEGAIEELSALLARQQALLGDADFAAASIATQKAINHLSGNDILNFYYDALLDSIYFSDQGKEAVAKLVRHSEAITVSQASIVDAVLHRDQALARRRVLQHHAVIERYIGAA